MHWELVYNAAGETILANVQDGVGRDTTYARLVLRRESDGKSFRLTVVSKVEDLPGVQVQSNLHQRTAHQIREHEEWIAILERADIRLRGSSTELRCSVAIREADLQGREQGFCDNFRVGASEFVIPELNSLLGVAGRWSESE